MLSLCIRYTLDTRKLAEFEAYVSALPSQIAKAGGDLVGYFLPTKFAGPTDTAIAIIEFNSLAAYEAYRTRLASDPDSAANVRRADELGCILTEN